MTLLVSLLSQLLQSCLPQLLAFASEKANEPTTVESGAVDEALRSRLLAAIRLRRDAGGDGADH